MPTPKASMSELTERERHARLWREFRQSNLLSQARFAGMVGICRRQIQLIENGTCMPRYETQRKLRDLARKLGGDNRRVA